MNNQSRYSVKNITKYRQILPYDRMAAHVDSLMEQCYLYNEDWPEEHFKAISSAIGDVVDALHSAKKAQDAPSELVKVTNVYVTLTDALAVFDQLSMEKPALLQKIHEGLSDAKCVLEVGLETGHFPDSPLR